MNKPPLIARTKVVTSVEESLIEAQRAVDIEHYEAGIARLEAESAAQREIISRLSARCEELEREQTS